MSAYQKLTAIALKYLPRRYFLVLRTGYFSLREKFIPVRRLLFGSFNSEKLRHHLDEQLPSDFEILMVHSSFNCLKMHYQDSAVDFVRTLVEYCGPDRTLAMPAFYFGDPEVGNLRETFAANPRFDTRRTPSQMGFATEVFRRWKGVIQSKHPVYRISAFGPLAEKLTEGHEFADGPAGAGSPFEFMSQRKTLIIGIGKSFDVMTQTHHVEAIMGDQFPIPRVQTEDLHVILIDGKEERKLKLKSYHMEGRFNIGKLPSLLCNNEIKLWKYHTIPMFSAEAAIVTTGLIEAARSGNRYTIQLNCNFASYNCYSMCSNGYKNYQHMNKSFLKGSFHISSLESDDFARLSGDFNPLHVDETYSRRLQYGRTVIHGIHHLLRVLEEGYKVIPQGKKVKVNSLSASFHNPVSALEEIDYEITYKEQLGLMEIKTWCSGMPAMSVALVISIVMDSIESLVIPDDLPTETLPKTQVFPPTSTFGICELYYSKSLGSNLFPLQDQRICKSVISSLLSTTKIVGMYCPGLHSIFSGLDLKFGPAGSFGVRN